MIMNSSKQTGWRRIALVATLILLVVYVGGKRYVGKQLIKARATIELLETELQAAQATADSDKTNNALVEQEAAILQQANDLLRESERKRQDEIASLKADLAFYRRLGGASGSQAALAIHHVELRRTDSPRVFELAFTLTQNIRWAAVIAGDIDLTIDGIKAGQAVHLSETQLLAKNTAEMQFEFKYFQQLERLITLPEGFEANYLTLTLYPKDSNKNVEQSISWQELFDDNASIRASD